MDKSNPKSKQRLTYVSPSIKEVTVNVGNHLLSISNEEVTRSKGMWDDEEEEEE